MQRLPYLLQRYFENTATPEEVDEIMPFIEDPGNEAVIKTAMDQFWNDHTPGETVFSPATSQSILSRVLAGDTPRLSYPTKKKHTWLFAAAAAVTVMFGAAAFYLSALKESCTINRS